jgi:hypothetical protein
LAEGPDTGEDEFLALARGAMLELDDAESTAKRRL